MFYVLLSMIITSLLFLFILPLGQAASYDYDLHFTDAHPK